MYYQFFLCFHMLRRIIRIKLNSNKHQTANFKKNVFFFWFKRNCQSVHVYLEEIVSNVVVDPGFSRLGDSNPKDGVTNPLFGQISPKAAWKWKKLKQEGALVLVPHLLDSMQLNS